MSWFACLVKTYDKCNDIVGIPDNDGNVLLPQNHMIMKSDICITIDSGGAFRFAEKSSLKIAIPCTEDSASRSGSAVFPHPLHDQLGYLALDENKNSEYISLLAQWSNRHPKVEAVYRYIIGKTIVDDLKTAEITQQDDPKLFVRFSVEIPHDITPHVWEDETVRVAWIEYCARHNNSEAALCFVVGEVEPTTWKHPKGINSSTHGAKLVSYNDGTNYTYKGRFTEAEQTNAISVEASYKAHAMLNYLIESQGYKCDTQAIVAWVIDDGAKLPSLLGDSLGLHAQAKNIDSDRLINAQALVGFDYAKSLREALCGKDSAEKLKDDMRRSVVLAEDAATTGRMGITFYQELSENEYIERICDWHNACKWHFHYGSKAYISTPSGDKIIAAVYGEPKRDSHNKIKDQKSYSKIKKQARERLLHSIVCKQKIDRAWVASALRRVSSPFTYDSLSRWQNTIGVVCAIARKYYRDKKEVFALELEKERTDRDYLYGRLLAIADRLESHARYLQAGKNETEKRPTNAVRYMQRFASKPFSTWNVLWGQLNPYVQRLNGAEWYQREIDEIMGLFESVEKYGSDEPLSAKYLMGYSLQRREFFKSNGNEEKEKANGLDQKD